MEDVGYVSQNSALLEQFRATGVHTLCEEDLLKALQLAMLTSSPQRNCSTTEFCSRGQLTTGLRSTRPLSDTGNRTIWKRDIRMGIYRNLETATDTTGGASANDELGNFLRRVTGDASILEDSSSLEFLAQEIGRRICAFMLRSDEDLDLASSLTDMGVDSLVSIEIRNWWHRSLGLEISVLEVMNAGTILQLGKIALGGLRAKYASKSTDMAEDTYLLMKAP